MKVQHLILLGLLGIVHCITEKDFYPFDPQNDLRLPNGDSTSSHKLALSIPAKFYDTEYDYLWINVDGYITFDPDVSNKSESDFPFNEALLSPFMSDLDTTTRGEIFYRESNDDEILTRATTDIRVAFPRGASDFEAESVFIVTWYKVEGKAVDGTIARFTFQCVIVSNGRDSYAIFLYPEKKMGVVPAGVRMKSALFQARAGFNQGREEFLEMYPVESLVDHRNTRRNGEWIFQIGGEGVRNRRSVLSPENVRPVKRQTTVLNVQEINLTDDDEEDENLILSPERRVYDYCSRDVDACLASNSECVNYDNGYCCRCLPEFYGNGKVCIGNQETVRVNGKISGVVDVQDPDGTVVRQTLTEVDLHSFVLTADGRAYTAISRVNPVLGRALQPISTIGDIVGWLFAVPTSPAVNGFQFTGGNFQRQVRIRYENNDFKFDLRQRFKGVREEDNANVVMTSTNFVGRLPAIAPGASVKMPSYEEEYVKQRPGRFTTNSLRSYTVNNTTHRFTITQDIIFNECRESFSSVPDRLNLIMSETFLNYHDDDDNVRYAMNSKIVAPGSSNPSHPCSDETHGCDRVTAVCEPSVGSEYTCRCRDGYAGDGRVCDDIDECVRAPCARNQDCVNSPGSYTCVCQSGHTLNAAGECDADDAVPACTRLYDEQREWINRNPNVQDGPDLPECDADGLFEKIQCNDFTGECWCVESASGTRVNCSESCPSNQVFSTCAGCFTTCEERSRPKVCTLQCRQQCTCPPNLPYLNGDTCVTADQCPSPNPIENCPSNQVFSSCAGCFTTCEERSRPKVCTLQCRQQCTCPPNLPYLNGDTCVTAGQCPSPNPIENCPSNQVFSSCAGCFTTCEERSRPKVCTLQCRQQCTCPPNLPYLNGDTCVTGDQCPSTNPAENCPSNQVFSSCAGCFTTCEERSRPKVCTLQCRQQCTCPPNLPYLNGDTCVTADQCPSTNPAENCPSNQVFSSCAGCSTTCEERSRPKVCTLQCRQQCTCPPNLPYLNGDTCVTADQCPSTNPAENCPSNQVFSTCASCFTTCEERSRPKVCTLQCRQQCTCPPNLPYLNGDTCVTADQCPSTNPAENCPSNQVFSTCAGCSTTCEERSRFKVCTLQCRQQCTCPPNLPYLNGDTCVTADQCPSTNPAENCPSNQVFSSCAGCFTTCEERSRPKVCTLQCRQQCTCPKNLPYLNGDTCVTADQCLSTNPAVTCPSNQVFSTCAGCFTTCEERFRPGVCTRECRRQCTCPENLPYLNGNTCVAENECPVGPIRCPGNQVFSTCAGCWTTCEERFNPRPCSRQCRRQCTCPYDSPYLFGDNCVSWDQCPSTTDRTASPCTSAYNASLEMLRQNPLLQDGPDFPECDSNGLYRSRQCNDMTGVCWCVDPVTGIMLDGTLGRESCEVTCPGNQVFSTCAGCFTTCEERFRPRVCTRECRRQCTCPENLPYLNGNTCVAENECPVGPITCPGNQVFSTCAGCFTTCEERFRPRVCTRECRRQCTCPENLPYLNGNTCVAQNECPDGPITCPGNQVFSTCAGCFTTCEERFRPKVCTRECRRQCTCPENLPYLNGNTCVAQNECPVGPITCPGNQVFSTCAGCFTTCEERFRPRVCTRECRRQCTCPENLPYLNGNTCVAQNECPVGPITCPGNQVFSTCAGCFTTCEERFRPRVCTRECRRQCTCPENLPYLHGETCVAADQCPSTDDRTPCTRRYNELLEWARLHPDVQDGPDYPECDGNGMYNRRQCNDFTGICWCVDPSVGSMIAGSLGRGDCTDSSPVPSTLCERMRREGENRPGSFQPICTEAGAFEPMQYHTEGYFTCVDINGVELSRHNEQPECLTPCQLQAYYAETENTLLGSSKFVPQCKDDGSFNSVQCDQSSRSCYCADQNGQEISGTRISTRDGSLNYLECPSNSQSSNPTRSVQLLLAQSQIISSINLPASVSSRAQRLFNRPGRMAVGIAFDCSSQKIYWTDVAARAIYMAPLSDPENARVIVSGLRSPEGVTVDFITGNIYWTDSGLDRIGVASSDGSYQAVLVSNGLRNPRGIAVDPFGGKMYWADWDRSNPRIMRANMDGGEVEVFLSRDVTLPNNLAIDPYFRRICFIDDYKIKCMNMDGTQLETKWTNNAMGRPFDLAVDGSKIYYSNRIRATNSPSRVHRIYAVDTAAQTTIPLSGPVGAHGNVFGLAVAYTRCPTGYNHCYRNNGGCSNLCLPVPNGRTCKCPDNDPSCR